MRVLDLFAGIGGFSMGLEKAGFETVAFCEIDPYAQSVLKKNWPDIPVYDDVRCITADRLVSDGIRVDVITGGFPCQDISVAGNQKGIDAERSGLWSECARLLGELRPRYAIFENVTALLNGDGGDWFKRVLWDISSIGYDAEWHCISASELGAHHHRDRVWIVAYPSSEGLQRGEDAGNNAEDRKKPRDQLIAGLGGVQRGIWETEPKVGRVANGIPKRSHRLKCLGNAVVPQIPEIIGNILIKEAKDERSYS